MSFTNAELDVIAGLVESAISDATDKIRQLRNSIDGYENKEGVFSSDLVRENYIKEYEKNKKRLENEIKRLKNLKRIQINMN